MGTIQSELFVLDLDPAPRGEIEFFDRLQQHHPNARVLVIAVGTAAEVRSVRGSAGALQFIEKPFDLAEFGATVQALLGPWAAQPAPGRRGTLRDLRMADIAQLKCLTRSSAVVRLESRSGESGEIYFRRGEIFHAATETLEGLAALEEIFRWPGGNFSERELPEDAPGTIDKPWAALLPEMISEEANDDPDSLGAEPPPFFAAAGPGKKILVIDDTEMLLIFAADVLGTVDRTLEVSTASTGAEGFRLAVEKQPDLILLDYSLTDMNGDEVCRQLLGHEATARIPVLMMSGHLPELAHTAETYHNVVATLPKPFLSGALLNEVEKLLAAGPLSPPPPGPEFAAAPEAPAADHVTPLSPNGHGSGSHGAFSVAPTPPPPSTPTSTLVLAPPEGTAEPLSRPANPEPGIDPPSSTVATEQKEVTAVIACEVVSVQLAPDFRMGAMQLRPFDGTVTLRMDGGGGSLVLPPEKYFRLGPIQLSAEGMIATLQLIPTSKSPDASAGGGDFAVDRVSAESAAAGRHVQLTGASGAPMRVQLIAPFQLLSVALSDDFEVSALVLQSHSNGVRVQTGNNSAVAMHFFVNEVQLDESRVLTSLSVGSRR